MSGPLETGWEPLKELADEMYAIQGLDTRKRYEQLVRAIAKLNKQIEAQESHINKLMNSDRQLRESTVNTAKLTLDDLHNDLRNIQHKMDGLQSFAVAHNFKLTKLEDEVSKIERRVSDVDLDLDNLMAKLMLGGKRKSLKKKKSSKKRRMSSKKKKRVIRK